MYDNMKTKHVKFSKESGKTTATGVFENGGEVVMFTFFDDEINFSKEDLIGKTLGEARDLHHKRDVAYLQS